MASRRTLIAIPVIALVIIGVVARGTVTRVSIFEPGEASRAVAALRAKAGPQLQAADITLRADGLQAELQSATNPDTSDSWHVAHLRGMRGLLDWEYVSGPTPVQNGSQIVPVRTRAFALTDVDFDAVTGLVDASVRRAALADAASVTEASIERPFTAINRGSAGPLRWTVQVQSAHESARIFANPSGVVTGANLDGTLRAQRLDLWAGGAPLLGVVDAIQQTFGREPRIDRMLVYTKSIQFTAPQRADPTRVDTYSAGLNGVSQDVLSANAARMGDQRGAVVWSINAPQWASLPDLLAKARKTIEVPDAPLTLIEISRRARGLGEPTIEWEFTFDSTRGQGGQVTLDDAGGLRRVAWPRGRAPTETFLDPAQVRPFMEALTHDAGARASAMQITLTPFKATATIRDPRRPDALVDLDYTGVLLESGSMPQDKPGFWNTLRYDADWLFDIQEVDATVVAALPALQRAALDRLKIAGGAVSSIAIGRHRFIFERNKRLLVEVDVEGADQRSGRVYFDPRTASVVRSDGP